MPTYEYETIDGGKRFEINHSMNQKPLKRHPITNEPIKKIISSGFFVRSGGNVVKTSASCCGGACKH